MMKWFGDMPDEVKEALAKCRLSLEKAIRGPQPQPIPIPIVRVGGTIGMEYVRKEDNIR